MNILGIDPGNRESAYVVIDGDCRPLTIGKVTNDELLDELVGMTYTVDLVAIEMIASYGMAVGAEVFETCVWIGQYKQRCLDAGAPVQLVYRRDVKLNLCGSARAKDHHRADGAAKLAGARAGQQYGAARPR